MALFAMTRYFGDEVESDTEEAPVNQAEEILKRIHQAAEAKRKQRDKQETAKKSKKETKNLKINILDETPTPKKKQKRQATQSSDIEVSVQEKEKKLKKKSREKEISTRGSAETDEEKEPLEESVREESYETAETRETQGQLHEEIGGFTVIGAVKKKKIEVNTEPMYPCINVPMEDATTAIKDFYPQLIAHSSVTEVKRVLPSWLAHPSIIHNNVLLHKEPLENVTYLDADLVNKLRDNNITHLFPVQSQVIPILLQRSSHSLGKAGYQASDVCCSAPTGSGKTLAFVLPIVQTLRSRVVCQVRALVVLPVTDLATQVYKVFQTYAEDTNLKIGLAIGQKTFANEQQSLVRKGVGGYHSLADILVATPGRLVDHINQTPGFSLKHLTYLVMDEADRLMDEVKQDWLARVQDAVYKQTDEGLACGAGFRRKQPAGFTPASLLKADITLQKLLFSATLSQNPEKLEQLGLFRPKLFTSVVSTEQTEPAKPKSEETQDETLTVQQAGKPEEIQEMETSSDVVKGEFIGKYTTPSQLTEYMVPVQPQEKPLVILHMLHHLKFKNVLCFTNSVEATHRLFHLVSLFGGIKVREFSSNLHVINRERILKQFAANKIQMLICTDSMARGMDISNVKYVISYDSPHYLKTYIHRVGRTARAGKAGTAFTLLQKKEVFHFKKMCKEAGKGKIREMKFTKGDIKPLIPMYTSALSELEQVLKDERKATKK